MGLCKCPKKKVTNLFCFEHTVNVCEHCLVANHSRCVVQSYLQWLQDSDYDPTCRLCGKNLSDDSCGPCVRLVCYDLFHWSCLDNYERNLPANTAPAGYTCPICNNGIFPPTNAVSPVIDALRELLSKVNWARAGLGLPLIDEPERENVRPLNAVNVGHHEMNSLPASASFSVQHNNAADGLAFHMLGNLTNQSVIPMDETTPYSRGVDRTDIFSESQYVIRETNKLHDADTDKYKRRPALQWFSRWFSSRVSGGLKRKDPNAATKKLIIIILLFLIGFVTLVIVFMRVGRWSADDDPFLDPFANPNIRVQANDE